MIDTISLRVAFPVGAERPTAFQLRSRSQELRTLDGYRTLKVDSYEDGSVIVSFSVPQAMFFSSLFEYSPEMTEDLRGVVEFLFSELGIEVDDVGELQVCRLDLCRNLEVPRPASEYIIQAARYAPRRAKVMHVLAESASVIWSKYESLTLYDKKKQATKKRGGTMLRIEVQLKKARLVRKVTGIATFSDLLALSRGKAYEILHDYLEKVLVRDPPRWTDEAPDAAELWEKAKTACGRASPPLFVALYLSAEFGPRAEDFAAMRELMRSRIGDKAFSIGNRGVLDPVSATPMDAVFRRDVLGRLKDPPPEAA